MTYGPLYLDSVVNSVDDSRSVLGYVSRLVGVYNEGVDPDGLLCGQPRLKFNRQIDFYLLFYKIIIHRFYNITCMNMIFFISDK